MIKKTHILFFIFLWNVCPLFAQTRTEALNKITMGLGGENAIQEAHFLMFSCKPLVQIETSGLHNYIFDAESGDVRFEAKTKENEVIIALFNSITKTGNVYIDNKKEVSGATLPLIIQYFTEDSYWIITPMLIAIKKLPIQVKGTKIVDSQRYLMVTFGNPKSTYPKNVQFIDEITGSIYSWQTFTRNEELINNFICTDYKDIGGGLRLPTTFTDPENGLEIKFPIIAALVNIEENKFKKP